MLSLGKTILPVSYIILSFFILSCGVNVLSGEIIHQRGQPHTYDGNFVFTPDSHAVVSVIQRMGADHSEVLKKEVIRGINSFPIKFRIQLDKPLDFSNYSYSVSAEVFSGAGKQVGDLITETVHELAGGQSFIRLSATGIEDCNSEGSGGFCI